MENLDAFIEYLYIVEETATELTTDQYKKLQMIQSKVSEIVKKIECTAVATSTPHSTHSHRELQVAEKMVNSFAEFQEINEKIQKRGNSWVVLNKKGTKVLGTHSTKKEAVAQLQAIEISKAGK